jgi:hypothetical protein
MAVPAEAATANTNTVAAADAAAADYRGEHRGEYRGDHRGEYRGDHRGEYRGDHRGDRYDDRFVIFHMNSPETLSEQRLIET